MKTKILSLVLAAIMVISSLSLVSCKKEKTPYETVTEAIENTLALDTVKVVLDENSKQKVDGSTQTQKTNITSVFKGFNTEAPEYSTDLSVKTSGVTVEMGLYYKDGYFYLDALGSKTKVKEGKETDSYNVYDLVKSFFRMIPEGLLFHYKPTNATVIVDGKEHSYKNVWIAPVRTIPASLQRPTILFAQPSIESKDTKYPPRGFVQVGISSSASSLSRI